MINASVAFASKRYCGHFELEGAAPPSLRSDPASIKGGKSSTSSSSSSSSSLSSPSSLSSMSHHCHHHHQHQHPPHSEVWPRLHYQREGLGFSKNATHPHKWSCNTDKYMLWCIGKCQELLSCSHSVVWFCVVWGRGVYAANSFPGVTASPSFEHKKNLPAQKILPAQKSFQHTQQMEVNIE